MGDLKQIWECVAELRGHASWIYGVPITSNRILASVSGSQILLWNLDTQKVDTTLEGHEDIILSLSLSSDGRTLASGSTDKTIRVWDLATGELIATLVKRKDPIHSVNFSSDGKLLAGGGENKYKTGEGKKTTIYLWNVDTKELVKTLSGHTLRVNTVAFSPDNQTLASGSNDSTVRLWNISSGKELCLFNGHSNKVSTVAFTPDGSSLISSGDGGIKVWDVRSGTLKQTFSEESEYISCFVIDPSGQLLAFEVQDGIEVWHLQKTEKLKYLDFKWPTSMNFSFDGRLFASGDASAFTDTDNAGLVKVWHVPDLKDIPRETSTDSDKSELTAERIEIETSGYFDVDNLEDARRRITTSIVQRQGQSEFRRKLLKAYGGQCPITGCDVDSALEAAHIIPYQGAETNHPTNGMLLRADIHTLFDLHLLSIQPESYEVVIATELKNTCYENLAGRQLMLPQDQKMQPNQHALTKHYEVFLEKCKSVK